MQNLYAPISAKYGFSLKILELTETDCWKVIVSRKVMFL